MKLKLSIIVKLYYYNKLVKLMNEIKEYVSDRDSGEMLDYYEAVYHNKIVFLLRDKYKNF